MARNIGLLQDTMQHIADNPKEHDQASFITRRFTRRFTNSGYVCGTAACFAGRAALLAGWTVEQIATAGNMHLSGAALLGINVDEAFQLFDAFNTVPMLELMVKDLVNGEQLRPLSVYAWSSYRVNKTENWEAAHAHAD